MTRPATSLKFLAAMMGGLATPALSQSDLEKQLALLAGEASAEASGGSRTGAAPAQNRWVVTELAGKGGKSCSMVFRDGASSMGYIGPPRGWKKGYFFVSGPNVPFTSNPRVLRVALASDGDSNQTVRAMNYQAGMKSYAILFELTDFSAALDAMDDEEHVAVLMMEEANLNYKQSLFSGGWTDGHAAREKIRACLRAQGQEPK